MARKRMIDPEFWSDEEIGEWSFVSRLFYIGLWNFSDDEGRFKAHSGLLKSQIFPYDTPKRVKMEKCKEAVSNKVIWYEVDNYQYGYLKNFLKYQRIDRPQPSKLPPPPKEQFDEQSTNNRRLVPPNIKEVKLKEVNIKEDNINHKNQKAFEIFWDIYPNKKDKARAKKTYFVCVGKGVIPERILKHTERYVEECKRAETELKFIKHPATFLNATDFTEEPPEIKKESWRDLPQFRGLL